MRASSRPERRPAANAFLARPLRRLPPGSCPSTIRCVSVSWTAMSFKSPKASCSVSNAATRIFFAVASPSCRGKRRRRTRMHNGAFSLECATYACAAGRSPSTVHPFSVFSSGFGAIRPRHHPKSGVLAVRGRGRRHCGSSRRTRSIARWRARPRESGRNSMAAWARAKASSRLSRSSLARTAIPGPSGLPSATGFTTRFTNTSSSRAGPSSPVIHLSSVFICSV